MPPILMFLFQSTHPKRDVTNGFNTYGEAFIISIHTSQTGCDTLEKSLDDLSELSIHTSQTGCDVRPVIAGTVYLLFQSTHPKRDVTVVVAVMGILCIISIHTSQAGCDEGGKGKRMNGVISIHTAQAGCDSKTVQNITDIPH